MCDAYPHFRPRLSPGSTCSHNERVGKPDVQDMFLGVVPKATISKPAETENFKNWWCELVGTMAGSLQPENFKR